jgi:hypothetical protein
MKNGEHCGLWMDISVAYSMKNEERCGWIYVAYSGLSIVLRSSCFACANWLLLYAYCIGNIDAVECSSAVA